MKHLEGIRSFKAAVWKDLAELYGQLADGQKPTAFVISCSDSRYYPELVMQARPGDLFCLRNAGNMILPYDPAHPSEGAGTLEFAVAVLGIEHVVILGHYGCGLVESALKRPQCLCGLAALRKWVDQSRHAQVDAWDALKAEDRQDLSRAACRQHVIHQLDNVRTHPCVKDSTKVLLHGLIFDFATGLVDMYDSDSGEFITIEPTAE